MSFIRVSFLRVMFFNRHKSYPNAYRCFKAPEQKRLQLSLHSSVQNPPLLGELSHLSSDDNKISSLLSVQDIPQNPAEWCHCHIFFLLTETPSTPWAPLPCSAQRLGSVPATEISSAKPRDLDLNHPAIKDWILKGLKGLKVSFRHFLKDLERSGTPESVNFGCDRDFFPIQKRKDVYGGRTLETVIHSQVVVRGWNDSCVKKDQ